MPYKTKYRSNLKILLQYSGRYETVNMKLVVVDIQGFNLPEFYPKEISFVHGQQQTAHYLLKPSVPYSTLSSDLKKQIQYLEHNHHGLKYSSGYISDDDLNEILRNHLLNDVVDVVYVKGHQKKEFLEKRLSYLQEASTPSVVNVEYCTLEQVPNFYKDIPLCLNHFNNHSKKYMCSLRNSLKLYDWLYSKLPK